jgi:hypothetical protein
MLQAIDVASADYIFSTFRNDLTGFDAYFLMR